MKNFFASFILVIFIATYTGFQEKGIYPQGNNFPLALYSIHTEKEMRDVQKYGWNIAHRYNFHPSFLDICKSVNMRSLVPLPEIHGATSKKKVTKLIKKLSKSKNLAWWDFPEERRWWREEEMAIVSNYSRWTRQYDDKRRPNYMYIPGHYQADDVSKYVNYLDIIPASIYTTYVQMPHAWVRWRMQATIDAIKLSGHSIGDDYLNGQKTPVAVLELFYAGTDEKPAKIMSPAGAYHDFWQSIVSGARGILVFSYWHIRDKPEYLENWEAYNIAAQQLGGKENLGEIILRGKAVDLFNYTVNSGPTQTEDFLPPGGTKTVYYPSIDYLVKEWNGHYYIIMVNSTEEEVSITLRGIPENIDKAAFLFEGKSLKIRNQKINFSFDALGVHIIKF